MLCIFVSFIRASGNSPIEPAKHNTLIRVLRALAIIVAILLIPFTSSWSYKNISSTVYEFKSNVEGSSNPLKSVNLFDVLAETTGAGFLKESGKNVTGQK